MNRHGFPGGLRRGRGITLVELMVSVAIIAILAAVAVPGYNRYSLRSYRTQAMTDLGICALAAERMRSDDFSYKNVAVPGVCPLYSPSDQTIAANARYQISVTVPPDFRTFTLRATPLNGSVGNGMIELESSGRRSWDKDNSGGFSATERDWKE